MATAASRAGERVEGQLETRTTTDRVLLRAFLERDRLYAAYAICDLDAREFARTRWGAAFDGDRLLAVALEYVGFAPQPLFLMGDPDGVAAVLHDVIRPRAAYGAHVGGSVFVPARSGGHGAPAALRDRGSQPPLQPRLHLLAARRGGRAGGLLRDPRGRSAGRRRRDPRHQRGGAVGGRGQRDDPPGPPQPRPGEADHERRHAGAAAHLRPGRAQRSFRQPSGAGGLRGPRVPRARPLRGAPRQPPLLRLG